MDGVDKALSALQTVYLMLLLSPARTRTSLEPAMDLLRNTIAEATGFTPEEVQEVFERRAASRLGGH